MDARVTRLDILKLLKKGILAKQELRQFSSFCAEMSSELPKESQELVSQQVLCHQQDQIQRTVSLVTDAPSIKLLLFLLFQYHKDNLSLKADIQKNRAIRTMRSNELPQEQLSIAFIYELEQVVERLKSTQKTLLGQISKLRNQNVQKGLQILRLSQQKKSLELIYKEEMCNVMLQLNDCINSLNHKQDLEQLQQELQIARSECSQKQETIIQLNSQLGLAGKAIDSIRNEHAAAQKQLQSVKEQHKITISELKERIKSLQTQLNTLSESQQSRLSYLISFANCHIKQTLTDKPIQTKENFIDYLVLMQKPILKSSDILAQSLPIRYFLVQQLQAHAQRSPKSTSLLYKYDRFSTTCGEHFANTANPFIVLFKLANGRVCGGYCPGLCLSQQYQSFLFTYLGTGRAFSRSQQYKSPTGCAFSHNNLRFGSDELVISNRPNQQFKLGANIFGSKCYNIPRTSDFVQGEYEDNRISFVQMEIHTVLF